MIGKQLAHFRIDQKLGEGGMGVVYRATDSKLQREVAIKVLPSGLTQDDERMSRFAREATVLAGLNHPNIATVFGVEETGGDRALVMELVEGESLAERLERGPLSVDEALTIALQIAEALEYAHENGVVHRDLKPANVMLDRERRVKVLDFGLAKALESQDPAQNLSHSPTLVAASTQAGVLLGTAAYMSPEQARGEPADRRADIWSFGTVLMEMLTGRSVYGGKTVSDILAGVLAREPEWDELPGSTPAPIRRLLERCLDKDLRRRLQSIGEARIALASYLEDPAAATRAGTGSPPRRGLKAALPWALAALLGLALVAVLLFGGSSGPSSEPPLRLKVEVAAEGLMAGQGSSAVISPRGTHLALVVGTPASTHLEVRALDQPNSVRLQGTDNAYNPFFSPDGKWIGFVTPNELKKVAVNGGTPLTLCGVERSRGASWGDDDWIVFTPNPAAGLFRVPATGGEPEPLTTLDEGVTTQTHRWPHVLPGSRHVLFVVQEGTGSFDAGTIEAVDVETGERREVHRGGSYPLYLPSGHLAYVNEGTLFAAPFDPEKLELLGTPAPVLQRIASSPNGTGGAELSVSGNGTLVYKEGSVTSFERSLVWVDRQGGVEPFLTEKRNFVEPVLSPDGTRVAVEVITPDSSDAWVFDLERGSGSRLTFHEGRDEVPIWSPDGEYIVFSSERTGLPNLFRKRSDGSGEAEQLTDDDLPTFPSDWSPDGRHIVFNRQSPQTTDDLWILPLDGVDGPAGEPEPYLTTQFGEAEGTFSPDGRWIAYASDESGLQEIYVRPFPDRGGKWQISVGGGRMPRWTEDGREIVYRLRNAVYSVEIDGGGGALRAGRPRKLFEGAFPPIAMAGIAYADYDVTADGQRFMMLAGEEDPTEPGSLVFGIHWLDELERTLSPAGR